MGKTVYIINQFAGKSDSGWGERHYFFSKYWKDAGYKVYIISGSYNHVFNKLPDAPNAYNFEPTDAAEFCWVKTPVYNPKSVMRFWSFLVFSWKVLFLPVSKMGKPDVIVVSSMPIFPIFSGYILKKRNKASKLIFEIRDIWPLTLNLLGNVSKWHPLSLFIGWFEKFGYKKADVIVSLLPNAAQHFDEVAGAGHKFKYIPNGLDESVLQREKVAPDILEKIPGNKFVIGYTGTIGLANALEYFVDAAGFLKDDPRFYFIIVGEGYLKAELIEKSKNFGNILFFPKIRKNQVQHMVEQFDLCFVGRNDTPLFQHGVSANKYFDYMLAAKPVLDSNNLIKDPVELSGCGLVVKPDSAQAIVEGIEQFEKMSKEERKAMGEKGRVFVKENHNIRHLANLYSELFEQA
ncbi:MAG: glycosyltransferase family 4 protein [Flavobacteriales bacterium]|nr:glycosyltransferase family 4 protein [Flavobacteriales bacterium]